MRFLNKKRLFLIIPGSALLLLALYLVFVEIMPELTLHNSGNQESPQNKLERVMKRKGPPLIFAHRGDHFFARANSLRAVEAALEHGYDGVELDIAITRDGIPVLLHDESLEFEGKRMESSDLTIAQIASVSGKVVTVEDLLDHFGGKILMILEVKFLIPHDPYWPSRMCRNIAKRNIQNTIILSSLNLLTIQNLEKQCPGMNLMYEMGMDAPYYYRFLGKEYRHPLLSMEWKFVSERGIPENILNNYAISVYTPNGIFAQWNAMKQGGLLIQTDHPGRQALLRSILDD